MVLLAAYNGAVPVGEITAWLLTVFFAVIGYKYLKYVLVNVVMKFYDIFIGSKDHLAPY